jgi:hypothetical protein
MPTRVFATVGKTCPCGKVFCTTTRNRLGLCPACMRARHAQQCRDDHAEITAMRQEWAERRARDAAADEVDRATRTPQALARSPGFGPPYGFASLGSLYAQNTGRLAGMRIRMDYMQAPHGRRPKRVLYREVERCNGSV